MSQISEQELNEWILSRQVAILYFKSDDCSVCGVLLTRLQSLADELQLGMQVIDLKENPQISGSQMVFNVPVTKVFYEGREVFKEGAFLDFERLRDLLGQMKEEVT